MMRRFVPMYFRRGRPRFRLLIVALIFVTNSAQANAPLPIFKPAKSMPAEIGSFHLIGTAREMTPTDKTPDLQTPFLLSTIDCSYQSADGVLLYIVVSKWESDSAAYSYVTALGQAARRNLDSSSDRIGTASLRTGSGPVFYKGHVSVDVIGDNQANLDREVEFARSFASTLDNGEGDIPVLTKHLP